MEQEARSGCPINAAVEAFGDSWSLLVLRDVMFGNRRYFRELLAGSEERIASNILADRLKRLVSAGLLTREDAGPGRRAAYSLTEASIQLVPVFAQLGEWGLRHRPTTKRLRVRAEVLAAGARRCGPNSWPSCGPSTLGSQRQNGPVPASSNASPRHTPLQAEAVDASPCSAERTRRGMRILRCAVGTSRIWDLTGNLADARPCPLRSVPYTRTVKIPSGVPYPQHRLRPHQPGTERPVLGAASATTATTRSPTIAADISRQLASSAEYRA